MSQNAAQRGGNEYEWMVHTYMSSSKRKRQVANDISIDFTDSIQTTLTIPQLNFLKNKVGIAHPIRHISHSITARGSTGFFRDGRKTKNFGFPALVKTGKGEFSKGVVPTSDTYLNDTPHYAHIIAATVYLGSTHQLCLGQRLRHLNSLGMT